MDNETIALARVLYAERLRHCAAVAHDQPRRWARSAAQAAIAESEIFADEVARSREAGAHQDGN